MSCPDTPFRSLVERFDRTSLPDGVAAAEQQRRAAANRVADILELEPIGVRRRDLDPLRSRLASKLDAGHMNVKRIVGEQASLLADELELVSERHDEAAVEVHNDIGGETERCDEDDVDAALADDLLRLELHGLAAERPDRVHAVTPDVHQRAAVELRLEPCVASTVHRRELEAERRADDSQPPDGIVGDETLEGARLRVMPPHETFGEDEASTLGDVEGRLDLVCSSRERLLRQDVLP